MNKEYKTSELIEYLDHIYGLVEGEYGLGDELDKPKYKEIKSRLLELDKIEKNGVQK